MHSIARIALPLLAAASCGCTSLQSSSNFLGVITPYRVEVVQGNALTREQVAMIKPGMGRSQVRDILGSPLLTDAFHLDRWDYVFTIRRQGAAPQRRSVVARFEGETLKTLEAPADLPSEQEFVASISTFKVRKLPPLELTDEQRKALPLPPKVSEPAVDEPTGPARDYPPLEPDA